MKNSILTTLRVILGGIVGALIILGGGYWLCKGLNFLTGKIVSLLAELGQLLIGNKWIVVVVILLLAISAIPIGALLEKVGNRQRKPKKAAAAPQRRPKPENLGFKDVNPYEEN